MAKRVLKGKRIAVLAADGFEKVELTIPMKALKLAGAKVDVISLREGSIRGVNLHEPASRVDVTKTVQQANPDDYDALLVPGGFINPDFFGSPRKPASSCEHLTARKSRLRACVMARGSRVRRPAQRENSDELARRSGRSCKCRGNMAR